jgi:hypothetical protein
MKMGKVIFIEDEPRPRATYERILRRIFGPEFEVVALEPEPTLQEMMQHVQTFSNVVTYVIDEKLNHTGVANYTGTEFVNGIRTIDQKVPIYILTSDAGSIEPIFGDIEFVIDKHDISDEEKRVELAKRMMRHINTFNDIKSERATRLDDLLKKYIEEGLTEAEQKEFNGLNFLRTKPILLEEQGQSDVLKAELDKQADLLRQIDEQLKEMGD